MKTKAAILDTHDFKTKVLLYKEGGQFVAHALEMDLLGYGRTRNAAVKELRGLVKAQISFARNMDDDSLLLFPAEREYFERWDAAHRT